MLHKVIATDYQLVIPADQHALLVLFPCFGCDAADTRSASHITDTAVVNGIAVMLMNFNHHLMLDDTEANSLVGVIEGAVNAHGLDARNTFIGGFSSGGNVGFLLARSLLASPDPTVRLKGVFAVDSPLDLSHLYAASKRRVERASFPQYKDEARLVLALLDSTLWEPGPHPDAYETHSPMTATAASVEPFAHLPVRFYTEPDTAWWWEHRGMRYEDMNAFALEQLHRALVKAGNDRAEFITTQDRGLRDGMRHPHAWSIVDPRELVKWMRTLSTP